MADIEKILDNLNIPKQILDKSEQLLKALFGQSFDEFGGIIADRVKLRRFKNQIKIFSDAQKILHENNINPQKVNLKVLAPLIDISSLEEEENLQSKWSKLIAYVVGGNKDTVFQQNCINILSKLTSEEAVLLEQLFKELLIKKDERYKRLMSQYEIRKKYSRSEINPPPQLEQIYPIDCPIYINRYVKENQLEKASFLFNITNLVSLGILQWHTNVDVDAEKQDSEPESRKVDVNVYVSNYSQFVFTAVGEKFILITQS
jgi:hypothetical protein